MDAIIIKEPIKLSTNLLVFDEDDNVYLCIESYLNENKITKCKLIECSGLLKEGTVNTFERSSYKKIDFKDKEIGRVSGELKIEKGKIIGNMKICSNERKPIIGTLVSAKAKQDFSLKISYLKD